MNTLKAYCSQEYRVTANGVLTSRFADLSLLDVFFLKIQISAAKNQLYYGNIFEFVRKRQNSIPISTN